MFSTAFFSYIILSAYTPGPNNIMAMTNSAKVGLRKTLPFCMGVFLGFSINMSLCAVFARMLFQFIPAVAPIMKWIGVVYILFLAYIIYRDKPHEGRQTGHLNPESMLTGVVMQFVNVKVILYGITALSTFILPYSQSVQTLMLAVATLSVMGASGTFCWAIFGTMLQRLYQSNRKLLNLLMALLLVYCAVASIL